MTRRFRPTFIAISRVSLGGSVASHVATQLIRSRGYIIHHVPPHVGVAVFAFN